MGSEGFKAAQGERRAVSLDESGSFRWVFVKVSVTLQHCEVFSFLPAVHVQSYTILRISCLSQAFAVQPQALSPTWNMDPHLEFELLNQSSNDGA